jgi:hypothetical protein
MQGREHYPLEEPMSPQPRIKPEDEKPETAEDVARNRDTPEPPEDKPVFTVEDYRARGGAILGRGFELPDIQAAFASLPKTRELSVADAKTRVREWLRAPVSTDPPLEG